MPGPELLLLRTKLFIPPAREDGVVRPRLLQRLEAGREGPLTLISAPAGSGKTTLLSQWIHGSPHPRVAWVSLDSGDNDPARFWSYVLAALQTLDSTLGQDLPALLRSPQPPPIELLLTVLLNELAGRPEPLDLVLDDYHAIENPDIHTALAFLIDHLPPTLHLILAGRNDPPLPLAPWRARRRLNELHAADLRFTPDEAAVFLNQLMGLGLSAADIAALDARTEGWIAGLQLAALSVQGNPDAAAFIRAFTGSHRYVLDYLAQEILDRQSETLRNFLLQTAILDRLSGPLCQAVAGRRDSQALLEQLEAANLFIVPLDQERRWYRYHALFAEFLRNRLAALWPDQVPELHRRAGTWYWKQHGPVQAIEHALAAGDFELAIPWISESAGSMFATSELHTLRRWLQALPEAQVRINPYLNMVMVWVQFATAHFEEAEPRLREIEQVLGVAADGDPAGFARPPHIRAALGEICAIRSCMAIQEMDLVTVRTLADRAMKYLEGVGESRFYNRAEDLHQVVAFNRAMAAELSGEQAVAEAAFTETLELDPHRQNFYLVMVAYGHLAQLQILRGALREAADTYRRALDYAADSPGSRSPHTGPVYTGMGNLYLEWNDLQAASEALDHGLTLGLQWNNWESQLSGYLGRMRLALIRKDIPAATAALDSLIASAAPLPESWRIPLIEGQRALVSTHIGDTTAAAAAFQRAGFSAEMPVHAFLESNALVAARVLLMQGGAAPDQADALLERVVESARPGGRTGRVIEARLLQAQARRLAGRESAALAALAEALTLAEPGGYVRLFADEGPALIPLLEAVAAQGIARSYISRLIAAITPTEEAAALPVPAHSAPPPSGIEPLSERELEVLRRIAAGDSNQEIAAALVVSLNTVKTHLKNIYAKLDVGSRTQAVARARQLNWL